MDKDFYKVSGRFIPLTKDWAVWGEDLKWESAVFKHLTCKNVYSELKESPCFKVSGFDLKSGFNLRGTVACSWCGTQVPNYIKQIVLLNALNI